MRRAASIAGSILFLVIAPGTVAVLVPQRISRWQWNAAPGWTWSLRILGGALILAGAAVLLDSFARFALRGLGTPAPVFPTKHLVVSGLYRHVRNPMYLAVSALILGQALLLLNAALVIYGMLVWLAFHLFVIGYEEPTLRHSFGDEYAAFCADVPRWIPRLHPSDRESS
jgi:protein-S-isoprenylcysteine O-methyltransferase Ste14